MQIADNDGETVSFFTQHFAFLFLFIFYFLFYFIVSEAESECMSDGGHVVRFLTSSRS